MKEKVLLKDEIIRKVIETYAPPESCKKFSYDKLSHELKKFVLGNKTLIGDDLYDKYCRGNDLSYSVLKRACAKNFNHPDNGAIKELRNLLCYYAYRMDYKTTLERVLGTTEDKEKKQSDWAKGKSFVEIGSIILSNAKKTIRTIPYINNEIFEDKKYDGVRIKAIISSTEYALINRLEFELKREFEKYLKEINTKKAEFIYTARDLALLMFYQSKYDEAYKFCSSVLKYDERCLLVLYITAYYYTYKKDFTLAKALLETIFLYTKEFFIANLLRTLIDCELNEYDSVQNSYYTFVKYNIYEHNYLLQSTVSLMYTHPDTDASKYLNNRFLKNHIFFYVFYIKSYISTYLGKYTKALYEVSKAIESEPRNPLGLARKKILLYR